MRGLAGNMLEAVQENPSIAAGICTFVVAFSLVAGNALYGQNGGHPVPLFATRDAITTRSLPKAAGLETRKQAKTTASSRIAEIPLPKARPEKQAKLVENQELVRQTQQALRKLGFYDGDVDGKYGPHTRQAIMRFEQDNGVAATGEVSASLVRILRSTDAPAQADPVEKVKLHADDAPTITNAVLLQADDVRTIPAGPAQDNSPQTLDPQDIKNAAVVARIQIGLINFGEAEVNVDGILNDTTASAIRRFQTRYGLEVDGMPGESLLGKMEQIGALKRS